MERKKYGTLVLGFAPLIVFFGLSMTSFFAHSAEKTATLTVSGTVANACSITSSPTIDLGTMSVNQTHTKTATVSVNCSNGVAYTVLPMPASATTIALTGNLTDNTPVNDNLAYSGGDGHLLITRFGLFQFYKDAGASQIWRNFGSDFISGTGSGAVQNYTVAVKFTHGANGGTSTGTFNLALLPTVVF
jgi:spore coat protein U-like protein